MREDTLICFCSRRDEVKVSRRNFADMVVERDPLLSVCQYHARVSEFIVSVVKSQWTLNGHSMDTTMDTTMDTVNLHTERVRV